MEKELLEFIENETGFRNHPITDPITAAIRKYFFNLEIQRDERREAEFKKIRENIEEITRLIS